MNKEEAEPLPGKLEGLGRITRRGQPAGKRAHTERQERKELKSREGDKTKRHQNGGMYSKERPRSEQRRKRSKEEE